MRDYYRPGGEAAPFERQALIKLRRVAGDEELGREVVPPGRFNVKLSRGGLVDVEYTAQYLQVMHGRERLELRTPETLEALARLAAAGLLSPDEHHALREGYLSWRSVIDGLRVVRGHAGDLLLPEPASDEYGFLARRLAYPGTRREAAAALAVDVERHRAAVAAVYDGRFRDAASA